MSGSWIWSVWFYLFPKFLLQMILNDFGFHFHFSLRPQSLCSACLYQARPHLPDCPNDLCLSHLCFIPSHPSLSFPSVSPVSCSLACLCFSHLCFSLFRLFLFCLTLITCVPFTCVSLSVTCVFLPHLWLTYVCITCILLVFYINDWT